MPVKPLARADGSAIQPTGADNEVWSYGEEAYPILVKYLNVRESMRGYVRETMLETHKTGKPVMRPMFYEYPSDETCAGLNDQDMFGARYLVAHVMEAGQRTRKVHLPAGMWRNVDTGETHPGGVRVDAPALLDTMPVFQKI
jgi:alpha-D-xyloside xylohydrolase